MDGGADADTFIITGTASAATPFIGGETFTTGINYDTIDLEARCQTPVVVTFDGPGSGTIHRFRHRAR